MLQSHKNAFLEIINNTDFSPSIFKAEEITPNRLPWFVAWMFDKQEKHDLRGRYLRITVNNTPLIFSVKQQPDSFYTYKYRYTQFEPHYPVTGWPKEPTTLEVTLSEFKKWIELVVLKYMTEEQIPDLWSQVENYKSFVNEPFDKERDTSDFSEEEKRDVRQSLKKFEQLVEKNFTPTKEQAEYINTQLNYLSEAVERLNRFDWRGLAYSIITSIAVNLSVDTEKGRLLFSLFEQAFYSAVKLLK